MSEPGNQSVESMTSTNDVVAVLDVHRFPTDALEAYLEANVDGFERPLEVRQFQGGMSNPTFMLIDGNAKRYVMRKKPPGKLLPSAHAVDREFRVISALGNTDVPVPRAHVLCEDESLIGTAFYVMEHVEGRVFLDPTLPDVEHGERAQIYDAMNAAMAKLHNVDFHAVGLDGFGRIGGYCERQISRWSKQYVASKTDDLPDMDSLMTWLPENLPDDDATTIAHGDYRLGNMIFDPEKPEVMAILDWELSTLGHPLADLAYNCLVYHVPDLFITDLVGSKPQELGIPDEAAFVAAYCERTGRGHIPNYEFYVVLSLFRLAAITQGVYHRGVQGNASDPRALERRDNCRKLSTIAWAI
jgi:aminoglycoside phosphotransferase (APT) family kinase protein